MELLIVVRLFEAAVLEIGKPDAKTRLLQKN